MLAGNKLTENVYTLRLLTEELLHSVLSSDICTFNDIRNFLSDMAGNSRTAHLWIDCLIIPVMTMMKYIHDEKESD